MEGLHKSQWRMVGYVAKRALDIMRHIRMSLSNVIKDLSGFR